MTNSPAALFSGNPVLGGFYADPELRFFQNRFWLYPTLSAPYEEETFFDAFSSPDLCRWEKHPRVLDGSGVPWARRAVWAPSPVERNGRFYLFFAANDIQSDRETGGIGVAAADKPEGPFCDLPGRPLIPAFHHGAQPIDPYVFADDDGSFYLFYGGWRHCNVARLGPDMRSFLPFESGELFREITPEGYVEAPCMVKRGGMYYFMWSEGDWAGPEYRVAYGRSASPLGPFRRLGVILRQDSAVATGAGHHSVLRLPGSERWVVAYHRRPLGDENPYHRVLCLDELRFDAQGNILPVRLSNTGVEAFRACAEEERKK